MKYSDYTFPIKDLYVVVNFYFQLNFSFPLFCVG